MYKLYTEAAKRLVEYPLDIKAVIMGTGYNKLHILRDKKKAIPTGSHFNYRPEMTSIFNASSWIKDELQGRYKVYSDVRESFYVLNTHCIINEVEVSV